MSEITPQKLTRTQAKQEICRRASELMVRPPDSWRGWNWNEAHQFNTNIADIRPDNSLPKVVAAAKFIARCYDVPVSRLIPEGVTA